MDFEGLMKRNDKHDDGHELTKIYEDRYLSSALHSQVKKSTLFFTSEIICFITIWRMKLNYFPRPKKAARGRSMRNIFMLIEHEEAYADENSRYMKPERCHQYKCSIAIFHYSTKISPTYHQYNSKPSRLKTYIGGATFTEALMRQCLW